MREHKIVLMAFKKLSMVINNLPRYVYIGDLHAKNVLVSDDRIRLIDIDGFSLKYGHKISCPLDNFLNHSIFCNEKYCDRRGNFLISRNSDICCVLWLFLSYLMKTEPFNYTESELRRYIGFLMRFGLPEDLYRMFNRMISSKKNYLVPDAFEKVPIEIFDSCSYVDFVKSSKL